MTLKEILVSVVRIAKEIQSETGVMLSTDNITSIGLSVYIQASKDAITDKINGIKKPATAIKPAVKPTVAPTVKHMVAKPTAPKPTPKPVKTPTETESSLPDGHQAGVEKISEKQIKYLYFLANKLGHGNGQTQDWLKDYFKVTTLNTLTKAQAKTGIDSLQKQIN